MTNGVREIDGKERSSCLDDSGRNSFPTDLHSGRCVNLEALKAKRLQAVGRWRTGMREPDSSIFLRECICLPT
ncbi:hypothetical protein WN51_04742 [Melipona quadrifasciata]|uniref:Uncharacterized protein n=1 Tax=Melipona quadrifasciata TaxID=166423 RepID=A0A0M8ZVF0_9HYME|nr:hypothetical protein WN51_04742 [Melipona quadrifasciata]